MKLLKTDPSQRISLDEICDHPWFINNPPIRQVFASEAPKAPLMEQTIKTNDYQVISPDGGITPS